MLRHARSWLIGLFLASLAGHTSASWTINMSPGATEVSRSVFNLHMTIFWISVIIGAMVFGVMFWSMIMHRRAKGAVAAKFHENLTVEILWTVIPLLILIGMAIPATKTLIEIYDTEDADLDILVTGYQWRWQYNYMGEGVSFMSNMATPREQITNQQAKGEHYLLVGDLFTGRGHVAHEAHALAHIVVLPAPLIAGDQDVQIGVFGIVDLDQGFGRGDRHADQDQQRNDGPENLDREVFMELGGDRPLGAAVHDHRPEHHAEHHGADDHRDPEDGHVQIEDRAADFCCPRTHVNGPTCAGMAG